LLPGLIPGDIQQLLFAEIQGKITRVFTFISFDVNLELSHNIFPEHRERIGHNHDPNSEKTQI
jgi:hypothetical protein